MEAIDKEPIIFDFFLYKLPYDIALLAGQERSCWNKIKFPTFESALRGSEGFNKKNEKKGIDKRLEPYPCPFCNQYHMGGKMDKEELNKIHESLKAEQNKEG